MKKFLTSGFFAIIVAALVCVWTEKVGRVSTSENEGQKKHEVVKQAEDPRVQNLNGDSWTLSFWPQPDSGALRTPEETSKIASQNVQARVPGNVERDLFRAGIVKDPEVGDNSYNLRKYEGYQWQYARDFDTPNLSDGERAILRFDGVDCFSDIYVNGKKVGETDNFFLEYAFDITEYLNPEGRNRLDVIIRSAVIESSNYKYGVLGHFHVNGPDGEYVRKPAHCYGWDILPRIVSAGLWRGVKVDIQKPVRIEDTYWFVSGISKDRKKIGVNVDISSKFPFSMLDSASYNVKISKDGKIIAEKSVPVTSYNLRVRFDNVEAELWWPRGYGAQPLYDAEVSLLDKDGKELAKNIRKIGFRTVELEYADICPPDEKGKFLFKVNGIPIFIKGTNWVPVDALHGGDSEKLSSVLEMLADLNCNMVRIWGGGVYEPKEFFDYCDANGILVWHDFCMGCTFYPQRDDFAKTIENEAIQAVTRIRNHPSMALWCGNNENDISLRWQLGRYRINPNDDRISREVLPRVLLEFDPLRPYLPSSPFISQKYFDNPKNVIPSESHLWNSDGYYKIPFFSNTPAIFCSEIGYHGCPNLGSLKRMMTSGCVEPFIDDKGTMNKEWIAKSVNTYKNVQNKVLCARPHKFSKNSQVLFGEVFYDDLDKYILASQSVQAEALKYFIELFRSQKFDKTGIIWWNLRDGWPVLSDAVVDFYNSKKLAYDFIKRVQTDELLLVNDDLDLIAVNDTLSEKSAEVIVTDMDTGKTLYKGSLKIPANGKKLITVLKPDPEKGMLKIEYSINGGEKRLNHFLYGKPPFDFKKYKNWLQKLGFDTKRK